MDFVLILATTLLLAYWGYKYVSRKRIPGRRIPGPSGLPFLGSSLDVNLEKMHMSFQDWAVEYGKIFKVTLFGKGIVVINDLDLLRKAFVDDKYASLYCNRPQSVVGKHVVHGNGDIAFSLTYDHAFATRKKLFSKTLRKYSEENKAFEEKTHEEIGRFLDHIKESEGADFQIKPLVRMSFGNLTSITLSGELPRENDSKRLWEFNDSVFYVAENSISLLLKWLPFLRHTRRVKCGRLFQNAIELRNSIESRYYYSRSDSLHDDEEYGVVDTMVKLKKEEKKKAGYDVIDESNIKSLLLDITAAGMTSTTNAIIASIGLLADHPELAKRIQDEVDEIIGHSRLPHMSDKPKMHFTLAFIYETLRFLSHGSIGLPHEVAQDHCFEGFRMNKKDLVFANIWYINRDPVLWDDPWTFNPGRFLDSSDRLVPPNHANRQNMITFSLGRRGCPGADYSIGKIFLYITSILQTFDVSAPTKHEHKGVDPRQFLPGLFLEPEDFYIRVSERS